MFICSHIIESSFFVQQRTFMSTGMVLWKEITISFLRLQSRTSKCRTWKNYSVVARKYISKWLKRVGNTHGKESVGNNMRQWTKSAVSYYNFWSIYIHTIDVLQDGQTLFFLWEVGNSSFSCKTKTECVWWGSQNLRWWWNIWYEMHACKLMY